MAVESHDKKLDDLLKMVEDGKAQLPDFMNHGDRFLILS